jgi:hypothetical protein
MPSAAYPEDSPYLEAESGRQSLISPIVPWSVVCGLSLPIAFRLLSDKPRAMKTATRLLICAGMLVVFGPIGLVLRASEAPATHVLLTRTPSGARLAVPPAWIVTEGGKLAKSASATVEAVRLTARQKLAASGSTFLESDIDALVIAVMSQATAQADADLRAQLAEMKKSTDKKKALRDAAGKVKDERDSLSDLSQTDQLHLQALMERKAQLEKMLSNVMKKSSDTANTVTGNVK